MAPSRSDVERMVIALFTVNAGLDRARRDSPGAGRLSVLQLLTAPGGERPSDVAHTLQASPSLVTRHVQSLEEDGLVAVTRDPADHRACLVSLTARGYEEMRHLQDVGVARFASFVAGWASSDVVNLTRLLERLEVDKHATTERERSRTRRPRWAQDSAPGGGRGPADADPGTVGESG